jgi:hypothetical protein
MILRERARPGQRILIDAAMTRKDVEDRECHLGVIRVAPGCTREGARFDHLHQHVASHEEALAEGISHRKSVQRANGPLLVHAITIAGSLDLLLGLNHRS